MNDTVYIVFRKHPNISDEIVLVTNQKESIKKYENNNKFRIEEKILNEVIMNV